MSNRPIDSDATGSSPFVVGIGASAGGLEALERFFDNVPRKSGMAFVLVQHLSPDFRSLMDELLGRRTELPIHAVEDAMLVEADHVYLIPPGKEMIISQGRLLLSERDRQHELSLPIDVFFRSLAQDCGQKAVAVVLSGGGSDGSRGIRAVHQAGGLVVVQDVESAQFDGMPKTAREAGVADYVLPPEEMPRVLVEYVRRGGPPPTHVVEEDTRGVSAVYRMLQAEFGIDFLHYKPSTVTRRIERRLRLARVEDIDEYVVRLRRERAELDLLYRDLLIGVTRFFRNEAAFEHLEKKVLPELFDAGPSSGPFRVWCAGCATGEEAYTLAIVLNEASQRYGGRPVQIFATDVHRGSLDVASRAIYGEEAVANVSPARLDRYFVQNGRSFQVVPEIRQMVVFAAHNVVKDAPFTRVDLISCRNLLIYLQPPAQQKVLSLFHFALRRNGVVFLGPSESPGALAHDFATVDSHWRMYRKYSDARMTVDARLQPGRGEPRSGMPAVGAGPVVRVDGATPLTTTSSRSSQASILSTYDALLAEFMPPGFLINDRGELVHSFGGASRLLVHRDGRQGLELVELLAPELKMVLVGGIQRAKKEGLPIVFKGVRVEDEDGGATRTYAVKVQPVRARSGASGHVLVTLQRIDGPEADAPPSREVEADQASRDHVGALEEELTHTKENLQAAIEELETSNEELQAANEELTASNEELQSTNEELQSVNEELYTVNAEYQRKIAELTELTNDMDNLLSSTEVGTIFLDKQLRIRRYTPKIAETFNLLPQDVGRSLETFTHNMHHPELADELRRVIETGERIEHELRDRGGRSFYLRLLPYRAKGKIDGAVLTLIDVTGLKAAEDALFHERYLLNSLLFGVADAIYFKDARGRFIRTNHEMARRLGVGDPSEAVGRSAFELPNQAGALALHQEDDVVLRSGDARHDELRKWLRDGKEAFDLVTRLPLKDRTGAIVGIIGIFRDVTEQKRAEERIREAVRRRDQFLAMLSHELRNPLGAVVTATGLLKEAPQEKQGKLLEILERQSIQMARLLDDLLEASRVTQNKIELRREVVDLRPLVSEAADSVRGTMEGRGVALSIDVGEEPLEILGDPARLQQVHVNLLSNAAKYTPRGGKVTVALRRDGSNAVLRVRDDGAGIPSEMLDEIFELFVQSKRTLDRSDGGLGVGLTLVRSLVQMHGGDVSAASDGEGKGSEFSVRLPLFASPAAAPLRDEGSRIGLALPAGSTVIVVEDNADSREMLCELLQLAGYKCHTAGDGLAGLEMITRLKPRVALVDIGLPGIDGFELAKQVRANPDLAGTYLVALTGYGQREDHERALAAGFDEHLVKPIDPRKLTRMLGQGPVAPPPAAAPAAPPTAPAERFVDGGPPRAVR